MDVILKETVSGLGRPGDRVTVKNGYARNYLLPKGFAMPVTADALRAVPKLQVKAEEEERALVASMGELAQKLENFEVEVTARATEEGHLFGSVSEKEITAALEGAGWELPHRAVRLEQHLKEAGTFDVEVHLYAEIATSVKVVVVPIDGEGQRIEPEQAEEAEAGEGEAGADEAKAEDGEGTDETASEDAAAQTA